MPETDQFKNIQDQDRSFCFSNHASPSFSHNHLNSFVSESNCLEESLEKNIGRIQSTHQQKTTNSFEDLEFGHNIFNEKNTSSMDQTFHFSQTTGKNQTEQLFFTQDLNLLGLQISLFQPEIEFFPPSIFEPSFMEQAMMYEQRKDVQEKQEEEQISYLNKKYLQEECQCRICFEIIKKNNKIPDLKCKHQYHDACLQKWIDKSDSCPLCRGEIFEKKKKKRKLFSALL